MENEDTATSSNMVRTFGRQTKKPYFTRTHRKRKTYNPAMERLFEAKHHYPLDAFNSLVADLQEANEKCHRMDRSYQRSSDDHD